MRFTVLAVMLALTACAGIEMTKGSGSNNRRDIPPGPGLLTGKSGEFTIYRNNLPNDQNSE